MSDTRYPLPPAPISERVRAVEEVLSARKLVPDGFLDEAAARAMAELSPRNGAKVVARAWMDPANTPTVHNVIVCTQCSCTAWPVLGLPPDWYKSPAYRARVVREPRALLREMGLDLPQGVAIRVWDTSAETRYVVLPLRPAGTEGWSEEQLAAIVTREAMIGVAHVNVD